MAKYVASHDFDDWEAGPGANWNNEAMPGCPLLGTAVLLPAAEKASQLGYLVMGEAVRWKPRLPYEGAA